jgi:hypothetical protein
MPATFVFVFAVGTKLRVVGATEFATTFTAAILTASLSPSFRESGRLWSKPRSFVSRGYARAARSAERACEEESSEPGAAALG